MSNAPLFADPPSVEEKPDFASIPAGFIAKLEDFFSSRIRDSQTARGGFSAAASFIVTCADGRKFFLKGTHPQEMSHGAENLRQEIFAYESLPILQELSPRYLGLVDEGHDDGWMLGVWQHVDKHDSATDSAQCFSLLARAAGEKAAAQLRPADDHPFIRQFFNAEKKWQRIASEQKTADKFDTLFDDVAAGTAWRVKNIKALVAQQQNLPQQSFAQGLLHGDLRSDNFIHDGMRAYMIDWANACHGPLLFDVLFLAAWLQGVGRGDALDAIHDWSGKTGVSISQDSLAALVCGIAGYFADQAYRAIPPKMPRLRFMQKTMLLSLLQCAATLGIIDSPPKMMGQIS